MIDAAPDVRRGCYRHEHESHRQQDLREIVSAVEMLEDKPLDDNRKDRHNDEGDRQACDKGNAELLGDDHHNVAAKHRKTGLCQIHEIHHTHSDG